VPFKESPSKAQSRNLRGYEDSSSGGMRETLLERFSALCSKHARSNSGCYCCSRRSYKVVKTVYLMLYKMRSLARVNERAPLFYLLSYNSCSLGARSQTSSPIGKPYAGKKMLKSLYWTCSQCGRTLPQYLPFLVLQARQARDSRMRFSSCPSVGFLFIPRCIAALFLGGDVGDEEEYKYGAWRSLFFSFFSQQFNLSVPLQPVLQGSSSIESQHLFTEHFSQQTSRISSPSPSPQP
jgi:hypothetical protein